MCQTEVLPNPWAWKHLNTSECVCVFASSELLIPEYKKLRETRERQTDRERNRDRAREGIFTLPSRYDRCLADVTIALSCQSKSGGVYSPFVKEPAFLVHWSRRDHARRPLKNNLHTQNVYFLSLFKPLACKNE